METGSSQIDKIIDNALACIKADHVELCNRIAWQPSDYSKYIYNKLLDYANEGNGRAQYFLAWCYCCGCGTKNNDIKAMELYLDSRQYYQDKNTPQKYEPLPHNYYLENMRVLMLNKVNGIFLCGYYFGKICDNSNNNKVIRILIIILMKKFLNSKNLIKMKTQLAMHLLYCPDSVSNTY